MSALLKKIVKKEMPHTQFKVSKFFDKVRAGNSIEAYV